MKLKTKKYIGIYLMGLLITFLLTGCDTGEIIPECGQGFTYNEITGKCEPIVLPGNN